MMDLSHFCVVPQAVAFVQLNGLVLKGKVAELRDQLESRLPVDLSFQDDGVPEYPTQDDEEVCSSDEEDDATVVVEIKEVTDMAVGEFIEVWWKGEKKWFEGEVTDIGKEDNTFEVLYTEDEECLWHSFDDYPCRYAC